MRPLQKGAPYKFSDGDSYEKARRGLAARIGQYCCYCERHLSHGIEVEHIQPKHFHPTLANTWTNFLLACKNCNSTKQDANLHLSNWLIPDRDNTFFAFTYLEDGIVEADCSLTVEVKQKAEATINLLALNRKVAQAVDPNGNLVALDRRNQRLENWAMAKHYRSYWEQDSSDTMKRVIVDLATKSGFFSVWMAAFEGEPTVRNGLLGAFPGTALCCFDVATTTPISPHANSDRLSDGGKA
jgi:uncharacterized protein (TIGR02646 family)